MTYIYPKKIAIIALITVIMLNSAAVWSVSPNATTSLLATYTSSSITTIASTTTANTTSTSTTINSTTLSSTIQPSTTSIVPQNTLVVNSNSTRTLNASEYEYEMRVFGNLGVSNGSAIVVPLNNTMIRTITSEVSSHGTSLRSQISNLGALQPAQPESNISVSNSSTSIDYGSIRNSSNLKYFPAGSSLRYAVLLQNGTINFVHANIKKASPSACIYVNLAASPICTNATTPAVIHVPVYEGHYGLTNQTWYPLNVTFKASLIGNQTAPFNFSISDLTNGTKLIPLTTVTSNSLNVSENFRISISDSVEITAGSAGNSNYTAQYTDPVSAPAGIIDYVPITFTNSQSVGVPNPYQLNVTVNSLAYQSYEASNLGNIEFFYADGTLIPSWLEGNVLNSAQTANLYNSQNTVYWLKIPGNFLPASSSNTLYMGFASTSTNLMDGITTGEAPQLSGTYAQYDNGASVFEYYNVNPSSTTGWTIHGTAGQTASAPVGSHFETTNALYANSANGDYMYSTVSGLSTNQIISFNVYTTGLGNLFFLTNSGGAGQMVRLDGRGGTDYSGLATTASWTSWSAPSGGTSEARNIWYKYNIVLAASTAKAYIGSSALSLAALGTFTNSQTVSNSGNYIGLVGDGLGSSYLTYWDSIIIRAYPPNGIAPTASFGSVVSTNNPTLTIPTNPLTQGQSDVISASSNPNTDNVEILVNGVVDAGPTTGTVTYNANVLTIGTYTVNALDTASGKQVSGALVIGYSPSLTMQQNSILVGQSDLISASSNPNTDNVEILVNGVVEAGPATGTVNFNANTLLVGIYTVKAEDTVTGISNTETLNINCQTPHAVPSGVEYYACVPLQNTQSSAAPSPFQQMATINSIAYQSYEAANLDNIEFFNYTGNVIPSWLESSNSNTATNTVYWLALTNSLLDNAPSAYTIPASSTVEAYMGFVSTGTNLFSTANTGEAPQLSGTYGQYDNGNNVFLYYNPYPASTSGWTVAGTAGQTTSAPSGSYLQTTNALTANGANGDYLYTQIPAFGFNVILTYWTYTTSLGDVFFLDNSLGGGQMVRVGCGGGWYGLAATTSWTSWGPPPDSGPTCNTWLKIDVAIAGSSVTGYFNNSDTLIGVYGSNPTNIYTASNDGNYIGLVGDAAGSTDITYWNGFILRAYPPNGIMPTASSGPINGVSIFTETGLPISGEAWSTTYDGVSQNAIVANTIFFSESPGQYTYSIPNVIVSGNTYVPSPASGSAYTANTVSISFTQAIGATTCIPEVSNTLIDFPSTQPGSFSPTSNTVTITNGGNAASNVLVSGTSWVAGANNFGVTNTLWSATSGANIGTQLTGSAVDTRIVTNSGASNSIYFGVNVPVSQAAGTYSQTITISTSC